jgi:hypothetical protein
MSVSVSGGEGPATPDSTLTRDLRRVTPEVAGK